jgi:hypothetical protein
MYTTHIVIIVLTIAFVIGMFIYPIIHKKKYKIEPKSKTGTIITIISIAILMAGGIIAIALTSGGGDDGLKNIITGKKKKLTITNFNTIILPHLKNKLSTCGSQHDPNRLGKTYPARLHAYPDFEADTQPGDMSSVPIDSCNYERKAWAGGNDGTTYDPSNENSLWMNLVSEAQFEVQSDCYDCWHDGGWGCHCNDHRQYHPTWPVNTRLYPATRIRVDPIQINDYFKNISFELTDKTFSSSRSTVYTNNSKNFKILTNIDLITNIKYGNGDRSISSLFSIPYDRDGNKNARHSNLSRYWKGGQASEKDADGVKDNYWAQIPNVPINYFDDDWAMDAGVNYWISGINMEFAQPFSVGNVLGQIYIFYKKDIDFPITDGDLNPSKGNFWFITTISGLEENLNIPQINDRITVKEDVTVPFGHSDKKLVTDQIWDRRGQYTNDQYNQEFIQPKLGEWVSATDKTTGKTYYYKKNDRTIRVWSIPKSNDKFATDMGHYKDENGNIRKKFPLNDIMSTPNSSAYAIKVDSDESKSGVGYILKGSIFEDRSIVSRKKYGVYFEKDQTQGADSIQLNWS